MDTSLQEMPAHRNNASAQTSLEVTLHTMGRYSKFTGSQTIRTLPDTASPANPTFLHIIPQRRLQQSNTGFKRHPLVAASAPPLLVLPLPVLHLLLVLRPLLQLLSSALLGCPQPLQRGHLIQQLEFCQEIHVGVHWLCWETGSAGPGRPCWSNTPLRALSTRTASWG